MISYKNGFSKQKFLPERGAMVIYIKVRYAKARINQLNFGILFIKTTTSQSLNRYINAYRTDLFVRYICLLKCQKGLLVKP